MKSVGQKVVGAALVALIGFGIGVSPADAAKAKKKAKKPVATKVPATLAPVLPPPPPATVVAPAPVATVAGTPAPVAPPATAVVDPLEASRQGFARMFAPRDAWKFESDVAFTADVEKFRANLNKSLGVNVWIAGDERLMRTVADNKGVAIIIGLAANPSIIRPDTLQTSVRRIGASLQDQKTLKVDGGIAIAGTDQGDGYAVAAFENYLIQVIAPDRQKAQDAAFVVCTNMGHLLTE
jgi:hypothetical protein